MSHKSRRKPVRLSVASSSLEELKQEVEDTASYVQTLMALKIDFSGVPLGEVINISARLENCIAYLCERNDEAGKVLERLDPKAIMRRPKADEAPPLDVNNAEQTVEAQTDDQFSGPPLAPPPELGIDVAHMPKLETKKEIPGEFFGIEARTLENGKVVTHPAALHAVQDANETHQ